MENKTTNDSKYALISKAVGFRLSDLGTGNRLNAGVENAVLIALHMLNKSEAGKTDMKEIMIQAVSDAFGLADEKLVSQVRGIFTEVIEPIMVELHNLDLKRLKRIDFELSFIISDYIKPSAARIRGIIENSNLSNDPDIMDGIVYPIIIMPIARGIMSNPKFYSALAYELIRLETNEGSKELMRALAFRR